jgi:hypothetical protein
MEKVLNRGRNVMSAEFQLLAKPVWDYSMILEVAISRPAREVWPHLIEAEKRNVWTSSDYKTVAGKEGAVGEIFTHSHRFNGVEVFYEVIKVKPERQLVLKITYKDGESGELKLLGYDFHTLRELAGQTVVEFEQALAFPLVPREAFHQMTERQDKRLGDLFQNLKTIVEAEKISMMHWVRHTELTVAHPLHEVWPVFKDIRRWYRKYTYDVVSGEPYEAGPGLQEDQVLSLTSSTPPPGVPASAGKQTLITKIIKVVPSKEIVSVLWGSYHDWRQYSVFYVWTLAERPGGTTILVDCYGQAELVEPLHRSEFSDYQAEHDKSWHRSWSDAFATLRSLMGVDA